MAPSPLPVDYHIAHLAHLGGKPSEWHECGRTSLRIKSLPTSGISQVRNLTAEMTVGKLSVPMETFSTNQRIHTEKKLMNLMNIVRPSVRTKVFLGIRASTLGN